MLHINLSDEEAAEIVATTAMEIDNIPMEIFAVSFAGKVMAELSKASEKKEKRETVETIKAGLWTIQITEMSNKKAHLVMSFRDHIRVDRVLAGKHEALYCAFNALLS